MSKAALTEQIFGSIPYTKWLEKAQKDLRDTPYQSLFRAIPDLGEIEPYYSHDYHSKGISLPPRSIRATGNNWQIRQSFSAANDKNASVLKALEQGLEGIDLTIESKEAVQKLKAQMEGVFLQMIELHLHLDDELIEETLEALRNSLKEGQIRGSLGKDLFIEAFAKDRQPDASKIKDVLEARLSAMQATENLRCLVVEASAIFEAGSTDALEVAYALACGMALIDLLLNENRTIDDLAPLFEFRLSASPDHFVTIAKFRAFRHMWARLIESYDPQHDCSIVTWVNAQTSVRNFADTDPHNNLLRTTTSAMAAISGSVDSLNVLPFSPWDVNDDVRRWARNIQHLLREEGHFAAVEDPAAGSYHTEELTRRMITAASTHLSEMNDLFTDPSASAHLKKELSISRAELMKAYENQKIVVVGANKYQADKAPESREWVAERGQLTPLVVSQSSKNELAQ